MVKQQGRAEAITVNELAANAEPGEEVEKLFFDFSGGVGALFALEDRNGVNPIGFKAALKGINGGGSVI